ncbi:MAG: LPS export ABC transporter periplasmic protein LptC [Desulfobacter sp.]|nr:LPS export ABC transporter periplasmic protein LptC [Desulfobacter sp.]WDP88112.1 MAG: LPS export ABC transporter periplasmic protein LptC [Desulfobacter sp.]
MTGSGKKKFILPLALILGAIFIGLGIFYYVNHLLTTPITIENINVDAKAALKLNVLEQVSKKNGITEWKLKASSATLLKDEQKAILKDVDVTFYTKEKTIVHLTANQGVLNTKTHDLSFTENVIVRYQAYTMKSETLHYDKEPHIIHTDSGVVIDDGQSVLEADAMVTKLNQNLIFLKGRVKGNFSEKFDLP